MNDINSNRNFIFANCQVRQMQNKRMGSNNMFMNSCQAMLQNNYQMNFAMSQQAAPSPYNMQSGMQFGNQSHPPSYANPMQNMQFQPMQNNMQAPPLFQQMPINYNNPMNPMNPYFNKNLNQMIQRPLNKQ